MVSQVAPGQKDGQSWDCLWCNTPSPGFAKRKDPDEATIANLAASLGARPGPAFTNPQDTLAEIGTGPPSWTLLYASAAAQLAVRRVAFRPLGGLTAHTCLAVPPGPPTSALRLLLRACAKPATQP